MRLRIRFALMLMAGSLACAGTAAPVTAKASARQGQKQTVPTVLPPAARQGWWIRVNGSSEAPNVHLRFGADAKKMSTPITRAQGDPEFDVPEPSRALDAVEISALGLPPDKKVSFCVFFQDHGVKLVEFQHEQALRVTQADRDEACRP